MYDSLSIANEPDETALGPRLEAMHEEAWRWALACCRGDRETALEGLQASYLAILEGRARFEGRSAFRSFVFGVIRMSCRATRRKSFARHLLFAPIEQAERLGAPGGQDRAAARSEIERAMAGLSARQREIAELVLLHGFTLNETAGILKISPGAANRHYARAKDRLRARLTPEDEDV